MRYIANAGVHGEAPRVHGRFRTVGNAADFLADALGLSITARRVLASDRYITPRPDIYRVAYAEIVVEDDE